MTLVPMFQRYPLVANNWELPPPESGLLWGSPEDSADGHTCVATLRASLTVPTST